MESNNRADNRISWNEYFMNIAELAARRSTCLRRQVGAVITRDNQILSTGYNGSPKGTHHCTDVNECLREKLRIPRGQRHELCRAAHAEMNAIAQCALQGVSCKGATIYTTTSPCSLCLKIIINAGITKIIAKEPYPDDLSIELLKEANIKLVQYNQDENKEELQ